MPETQDYDKSATPTAHQLDSAAFHTVSGLTPGHFLKATAPNAFAFAPHALTYSDVGADPAGAAAIVNGSLATHTALTTTAHGGIVASTDPRLSDSRTPLGHQLDGALHTVAGLTPGTFLKATGAATFGFAAHGLTYSDVGATPIAHKTTEDAINGLVSVDGAGNYTAKTIGSDVQAYNASLAAIAAGTWTGATSITTLGTITTGRIDLPNNTTTSQIKTGSFEVQGYALNNCWFGDNIYYNSGFKYRQNGYAAQLYFINGTVQMRTAPSGNAGDLPSLTNVLHATPEWNVFIGATATFGTSAIRVLGMQQVFTPPTTAPADIAQMWVEDAAAAAGKSTFHMMSESGTAKLIVAGVLIKTDTGDPTQVHEGLMEINTFDNKVKMYAEGAWRELGTW